jgi:hypothetical protein
VLAATPIATPRTGLVPIPEKEKARVYQVG